jgi:hypothetical protein
MILAVDHDPKERRNMKKLMVSAAMVVMTLMVTVPALADDIEQETEQEGESGEVNQSFEVTGGGDNSNQCAGIQGVANTGNAQNAIDVVQFDEDDSFDGDGRLDRNRDRDADFEVEEVGSDITVSPSSTTTCDQQVNQAASATG